MTTKINYVEITDLVADFSLLDHHESVAGVAEIRCAFVDAKAEQIKLPVKLVAPGYANRENGIVITPVEGETELSALWAFQVAHKAFDSSEGDGYSLDDVLNLSLGIEREVLKQLKHVNIDAIRARNSLWAIDAELSRLWQYGYWDESDFLAERDANLDDKPFAESIFGELDRDGVDVEALDVDEFNHLIMDKINGYFLEIERAGFDGDPERDCYRAVITTGGPHIEARIFFGARAELVYRSMSFVYSLPMCDEAESALRYAVGSECY